jgi:hypothetical protein
LVLLEYLLEGSRFELSAKIGHETVARFFGPESIDSGSMGSRLPWRSSPGLFAEALVLAFICRTSKSDQF